jgi:hypothetical protein
MILESAAAKWLAALALSAVAALAPIHALMAAVACLIAADLITGILAARKRGEKITSRAMSRTIYKCLSYQLLVISGFALEHLLVDVLPVAKLCAGAVGLVEFKSLAENVRTITGVDLTTILAKVQKRPGDEE